MNALVDVIARLDASLTADDVAALLLGPHARALLDLPGVEAVRVDLAPTGARASTRRWGPLPDLVAVVTTELATATTRQPAAPRPAGALDGAPGLARHWSFAVTRHRCIEPDGVAPDVPAPGPKLTSLLVAAVDDAEFRRHYRDHVALVRIHLPRVWRYVQNDIEASAGEQAGRVAAISELSYRSTADYERRWANGAESEAEFRSHEGFLDLPPTVTLPCVEHVVRRAELSER